MRGKPVDRVGQRYGKLVVLSQDGTDKKLNRLWKVQCDCGTVKTTSGPNLTSGSTISCGCHRIQLAVDRNRTHGMTRSPEFKAWQAMWQRTTNPKAAKHEIYLGKEPPPEWKNFETFFAYVGLRPGKGFSLDRIDGTKAYGPGNVRWADAKTQNSNRSSNVYLVVLETGEKITMAEAARRIGICPGGLAARLKRLSFSDATNGLMREPDET